MVRSNIFTAAEVCHPAESHGDAPHLSCQMCSPGAHLWVGLQATPVACCSNYHVWIQADKKRENQSTRRKQKASPAASPLTFVTKEQQNKTKTLPRKRYDGTDFYSMQYLWSTHVSVVALLPGSLKRTKYSLGSANEFGIIMPPWHRVATRKHRWPCSGRGMRLLSCLPNSAVRITAVTTFVNGNEMFM